MRHLLVVGSLLWFSLVQICAQTPSTLFERIKPNKSGVHFSNDIQDGRDANILIYDNFYAGAGVGVGDFNNDGLQDLYFAGNLVSDKLYLNKGEFRFEDITKESGIKDESSWSSGVTIADVNSDGFQDIYISKELYDDKPELWRNKLYINNGDLTFTEQAKEYGLADTIRSRHATFLDYDLDGDLDVFILNQPPNPGKYSKYLEMSDSGALLSDEFSPRFYENTSNKFIDVSKEAGVLRPGFCNSAVVSDMNGDGWPDIYVANDFEAPDFLYINNGNGTFTNKSNSSLKHISFFSMGVDIADINNDALLDILVVDMSAEDNYRSKANMSGMNPEKFWNTVDKGWHYQYMYNSLQLNNGNERFSDIGQLTGMSSTDWSWSPLIADFDNDGFKDVFITNGLYRDIRNNDADKKLKQYINNKITEHYQNSGSLEEISIWDLIDLKEALKIYPSQKIANYAFKNHGGFMYSQTMEEWGLDELTFSSGSAYADLDNDGDLDLIVNNINEKAHIYRNNADLVSESNFLRVQLLQIDNQATKLGSKAEIKAGDNIQYQELSNTRGMFSTSEPVFHFGLGSIEKVDFVKVTWPDGRTISLTDVKANQTLVLDVNNGVVEDIKDSNFSESDFKVEKRKLDFKHKENNFNDFKREPLLPHKLSRLGPALAVADVNSDGLEDFFVGGAVDQPGELYIQKSDGQFKKAASQPWLEDMKNEDTSACFFDLDGDNDPDLYVVSGSNEFDIGSKYYQDRLYINNGSGGYEKKEALPKINDSGSIVTSVDFDQDGDLDLFVGGRLVPGQYPRPASSRLLRNDGGKLVDVTNEQAPDLLELGMVTDALWTDFDSDGIPDLIIVGEWMPITFFSNNKGHFQNVTEKYGNPHEVGWWFSITSADIQSDGDEDYIIGNLGLNYKYKASEEEPFHIYYDDFDRSGRGDIVLGYNQKGKVFPVRGRECSSEQIPSIKERFTDYQSFAIADITQVYGKSRLKSSLRYEATTFSSIYLINNGGVFEKRVLPVEAQVSSINDIIVQDINADGYMDLITGGNMYSSEVETPRNDASYGVVMLANEKGDFTTMSNEESGLYLDGEVKHLKKIMIGNEGHVLVGKNNDQIELVRMEPAR